MPPYAPDSLKRIAEEMRGLCREDWHVWAGGIVTEGVSMTTNIGCCCSVAARIEALRERMGRYARHTTDMPMYLSHTMKFMREIAGEDE